MSAPTTDTSPIADLFGTVVAGGYCVGCGACAAMAPELLEMRLDDCGRFVPHQIENVPLSNGAPADGRAVCPVSDKSRNEDEIAADAFAHAPHQNGLIGRWETLHAGYVNEGDFRQNGTSGGMTNWIASELLSRGLVDAVIHIRPGAQSAGAPLFQYAISRTIEELREGAKTRYYPFEISTVMQYIRETPMRFALISLPCFARAARLLRENDAVIGERLHFQIAIVCGHLKSTGYAEYYGWTAGIHPRDLTYVDFRYKAPQAISAKQYFILARSKDRQSMIANANVYGTDWGLGFFKLKACDYCDDVLGETADITLGDAWLPRFDSDPAGTNIVITRHPQLAQIVAEGRARGPIHIEDLGAEDIARSQEAGFRHRRDGLAYRLYLRDRERHWRPRKRVAAAANHLDLRHRLIFRLREKLRDQSHTAFAEARRGNDLSIFIRKMRPLVRTYLVVLRQMNPDYWRKKWAGLRRRLKLDEFLSFH